MRFIQNVVHFGLSICVRVPYGRWFFFILINCIALTIFVPYKILSILGFPFILILQCFCWVFLYYISCIILPIFVINIFATLYETFFHYRIALKFHFSASNFKRIAMIIKTRRQFVFGKIKRRCFNYVDCYDM